MTERWATMAAGAVLRGRYRLVEELGRGGMGVVWEAEDSAGMRVAIKLLARERARTRAEERFRREALVAGWLEHPHVVRTFEAGESEAGPFIAMELVRGSTLGALLSADGAFDTARAVRLVRQILDALSAVHSVGVVHRDVKPGNVLIARDASGVELAKLADLGIAHVASAPRLTELGQSVGTPRFMAPEQVLADTPTVRTDVYAAGAVLYAALAGRPPFVGATSNDVYRAVLAGDRPRLDAVVPDLGNVAAVVEAAMAVDPARRFATADAMREALAPFDADAAPTTTRWAPRISVVLLGEWVKTGADPTAKLERGTGVLNAIPAPAVAAAPVVGPDTRPARPAKQAPRRRKRVWAAVAVAAFLGGAIAATSIVYVRSLEDDAALPAIPATAPTPALVVQPMLPTTAVDSGLDAGQATVAEEALVAERPRGEPRAGREAQGDAPPATVPDTTVPEETPWVDVGPRGQEVPGLYVNASFVPRFDGYASSQAIASHIRSKSRAIVTCLTQANAESDFPPPWRVELELRITGAGYCFSGLQNPGPATPQAVTACLSSELVDRPWPRPTGASGSVLVTVAIARR